MKSTKFYMDYTLYMYMVLFVYFHVPRMGTMDNLRVCVTPFCASRCTRRIPSVIFQTPRCAESGNARSQNLLIYQKLAQNHTDL